MKIGVIGTHGVGKDGIIDFLKHYCQQLSLHFDSTPELARVFASQGFPINESATLEIEEAMQYQQAANESMFEHRVKIGQLDHYACNRVRLDNYAYAEFAIKEKAREKLFEPMKEWMYTHPCDVIIKVPIWKQEIVPDGTRAENKSFQVSIEQKINDLLSEIELPHLIFPAEIFLLGEKKGKVYRDMEDAAMREYFDNIFETYSKK